MRIGIGYKIFSIAAVLVALMLAAAIVSVNLISRVKQELDAMSETHLPVSDAVSRITILLLEQDDSLQRLFVFAEEPAPDPAAVERTTRSYHDHTKRIERIINTTHALMEGHLGDSESHSRSYERLVPRLDAIGAHYSRLLKNAEVLLLALEVGDRATFEALLPDLDSADNALDREIELFRRASESLTETAAAEADRAEIQALRVNAALTVIAASLGTIFAFLVTRFLLRAVQNLVAGTQAVEAGNLDTIVTKTSSDEIGSLTDSFNHMIGELRLKERIKETFGKYMDPRIVSRLLDRPEIAEPGGERRSMTVMFIDLKGFTSISERLPPDDLVRMINRFFNHMTQAISDHNGVVDKFMGDAVMAFWGPPFTGPDEHAALACHAAQSAIVQLDDFRAEVAEELGAAAARLDIDLRIGISTGEMIVGTVGSDSSKSFTVVGDPVNLGSRLEGANKAYGTRILVADETRRMAKDSDLSFREVDVLRVKGKNEPVRIYELIPKKTGIADEARRAFERGLAAYRSRNWDEGETAFNLVLAATADDPPSHTYIARIAYFRDDPPPAEWDGVWVLEEK